MRDAVIINPEQHVINHEKKDIQRRGYAWTYYCSHNDIPDYFKSLPARAIYMVWQPEICPRTQRQHIQGYVHFTRSERWKFVKDSFPPGTHIDPARASAVVNRKYCMKTETRATGYDPVEIGECPQGQGTRNDLDDLREMVLAGKSTLECFNAHFGTMVRNHKSIQDFKNIVQNEERNKKRYRRPTVYLFWGEPGCGKTRYAYSLCENPYFKDLTKWWDGYSGQNDIIIDDLRPTTGLTLPLLLRILDGYPVNPECKGGWRSPMIDRVFITAPCAWEEFDWPSKKRDVHGNSIPENMQQLTRRTFQTLHFKLDENNEMNGNIIWGPYDHETLVSNRDVTLKLFD